MEPLDQTELRELVEFRVVRVRLTPTGEQRLRALTPLDREELDRLGRYPELFGDAVPQADLKPPLRRRRFLHRRRGLVGCGRGSSRRGGCRTAARACVAGRRDVSVPLVIPRSRSARRAA